MSSGYHHGMTPNQLASWRIGLSLTQADAAKALKVSPRTYQQWEQGRYKQLPALLDAACAQVAIRKPVTRLVHQ